MPRIQFRFEFSDYVRAQRLHRRTSRVAFDVLVPMCGAIAFAGGMAMRHSGFYTGSGIELIASLVLLSFPFLVRLNWRYCYRRTQSGDGDWTLEFSDDLIRTATTNSRSEIEWSAIVSFTEDKNLFLLYLAPAKFLPIPKRVCTPEEARELRGLFERHVAAAVS